MRFPPRVPSTNRVPSAPQGGNAPAVGAQRPMPQPNIRIPQPGNVPSLPTPGISAPQVRPPASGQQPNVSSPPRVTHPTFARSTPPSPPVIHAPQQQGPPPSQVNQLNPAPQVENIPTGTLGVAEQQASLAAKDMGRGAPGSGFTPTLLGDESLGINAGSAGTDFGYAMIQSGNRTMRDHVLRANPELTLETLLADRQVAADAIINSPPLQWNLTKYPGLTAQNSFDIDLSFHRGSDGLRVNPAVSKIANADFDGDTAGMQLSTAPSHNVRVPLDYLIGSNGKPLLDIDAYGTIPWGADAATSMQNIFDVSRSDANRLAKGVNNVANDDGLLLFSTIRSIARHDYSLGNQILNGIYRVNQQALGHGVMTTLSSNYPQVTPDQLAKTESGKTYAEIAAYAETVLPANDIDFLAAQGVPTTSIYIFSPTFRAIANIGKTKHISADDLQKVISEALAGGMSTQDSLIAEGNQLQTNTYREVRTAVGLPSNPVYQGDYLSWENTFVREYNLAQAIVEKGRIVASQGMNIHDLYPKMAAIPQKRGSERNSAIVVAALNVYPGLASELLGSYAPSQSSGRTLVEFANNNRVNKHLNTKAPFKSLNDLADGIINYRSVAGPRYQKEYDTYISNMFQQRGETRLNNLTRNNTRGQYTTEIEAEATRLIKGFRELYQFHGISSASDFYAHPTFSKMVRSKSPDEASGHFLTAVGQYYGADLLSLAEVTARPVNSLEAGQARINAMFEIDKLASRSDIWRTIAADTRDGGTLFQNTLLGDMPASKKVEALLSAEKSHKGGNRTMQANGVIQNLVQAPSAVMTGNRFQQAFGGGDRLNDLRDTNKFGVRKSGTQYDSMLERVSNDLRATPAHIQAQASQQLSSNPGASYRANLTDISTAIASSLNFHMSDTEKAKVTEGYQLLNSTISNTVNGSFFTNFDGFEMSMGRMHVDMFRSNPMIQQQVLVNPDMRIRVYSDSDPVGIVLSRDLLLGNGDLLSYAQQHPRHVDSAFAIRQTIGNSDGSLSTVRLRGTKDSMNLLSQSSSGNENSANAQTYNALINQAGFHALAAMASSPARRTPSQVQPSIEQAQRSIIATVRYLASLDDPMPEITRIMPSTDTLRNLSGDPIIFNQDGSVIDYRDFTADLTQRGPQGMVDLLIDNMFTYTNIINRHPGGLATNVRPNNMLDLSNLSSTESLLFYQRVLNASKGSGIDNAVSHNTMTTARAGGLGDAFMRMDPNPCSDLTPMEVPFSTFNVLDFVGGRDINGLRIDQQTDPSTLAREGNNLLLINPATCTHLRGPCPTHALHDPTTNTSKRQETSGARILSQEIQGSAENEGMMTLQAGFDGNDAIVKPVFQTRDGWEQARQSIQNAFDSGGMPAAREALADYFIATRASSPALAGISNRGTWINFAQDHLHVMPDGTLGIFSTGQVNSAAKQAVSRAVSEAGNKELSPEERWTAARDGIANLAQAESSLTVSDITSQIRPGMFNKEASSILVDHKRSNPQRNAELMRDIVESGTGINMSIEDLNTLHTTNVGKFRNHPIPDGYRILGSIGSNPPLVPGPDSLHILDPGIPSSTMATGITQAYDAGVNIFINSLTPEIESALSQAGHATQLTPLEGGAYMLPSFDLRLNGRNTEDSLFAFREGMPQTKAADYSAILLTDNFPGLGDASLLITKHFAGRNRLSDSGTLSLQTDGIFSALIKEGTRNGQPPVLSTRSATRAEIEMASRGEIQVVLPLAEPNSPAERRYIESVNSYFANEGRWSANGIIRNDVGAGDTIGLVAANHGRTTTLAPIMIPFAHEGAGRYPRLTDIARISINQSNQSVDVHWTYDTDLVGHSAKFYFGPGYGAIKTEFSGNPINNFALLDGTQVDGVTGVATVRSRLGDGLMQTMMETVAIKARIGNGYNIAQLDGTFPHNPEIREALAANPIPMDHWIDMTRGNTMIQVMPEGPQYELSNAMVNQWIQRGIKTGQNPSYILSSVFGETHYGRSPNWRLLIGTSVQEIEGAMEFFNFVDSTLVARNMRTESPDTLFNQRLEVVMPMPNGGYQRAWLMLCPHFLAQNSADNSPGTAIKTNVAISESVKGTAGLGYSSDTQRNLYHGILRPTDFGTSLLPGNISTGLGDRE